MANELFANLLLYDVGSTYTKLTAFHIDHTGLSYMGRAQAFTTVEDITLGFEYAKAQLLTQNITLSDNINILASSSAAGGLRMVAMGYMPRVTAKAAKEVAMNAGARVLEVLSCEEHPTYREEILQEIKPDMILLVGGTDNGDTSSMEENAHIISRAGGKAQVIIAGNRAMQETVENILQQGGKETTRVPNVMPTIHQLNVAPARQAIHTAFIHEITKAKGMSTLLETLSNRKIVPTPGAVLLGAELLAKGSFQEEGIGNLLVIDLGGATTDIHSILPELEELPDEEKGLVVSNAKQLSHRTVEGCLGLRISAGGVLETVGAENILRKIGLYTPENAERLTDYCWMLEKNPTYVPKEQEEKQFDIGIAISAIEVALKRHAGYIAQEFDPVTGMVPGVPIGRDLRKVKHILAVGGIFSHAPQETREFIVTEALKNPGISLLPQEASFAFDSHYFLYAIGILAEHYPKETYNFAKKWYGGKQ